MRRVDAVDVGVNRVFNQVAHRVAGAGRPVATPVADILAHSRVAIGIKSQRLPNAT